LRIDDVGTTLEKGGVVSHPSSSGMTGSGKLLVSRITGARGITANNTNDHREKDIGAEKTPRDPEE